MLIPSALRKRNSDSTQHLTPDLFSVSTDFLIPFSASRFSPHNTPFGKPVRFLYKRFVHPFFLLRAPK